VRYGYRADGANDLVSLYKESRRNGFGAEVKRRIMLGTYVLSAGYYDAYYLRGQKVRTLIRRDFDQAFEKVDAIATPTSPTPAFKFGEKSDDPLAMYLSDIYTVTMNLAGLPGISIPCGLTKERLPIGLQIVGPSFREETVLRVAAAFERDLKFDLERPPLPSRASTR
jgi:aspartyl-tRNA(Asn)/glutamyl-tRNA(Gln) amidotransferase subunit A